MTLSRLALLGLFALPACDAALDPSIDADAFAAAEEAADDIARMPVTAQADLPRSGTATYEGGIYATTTAGYIGQLVADMDMNVNFTNGDVSGTIDQINLIDSEGEPDQLLGGSLSIVGNASGPALGAIAEGELRVADADGIRGATFMALGLAGDIRSGASDGSAVYGVTTGTARGSVRFDLVDGVFYGTRED